MQAATALHRAVESGTDLVLLLADQAETELRANLLNVEQEAEKAIIRFQERASRVHQVALEFGASGTMATSHLSNHVQRARTVIDKWDAAALRVSPSPDVAAKVLHRVVNAIAPSRKGKENAKDCYVIETYLEVANQLRKAGFNGKLVFGSSNKDDYADKANGRPQAALATDFALLRIEYGMNFGSMKHMLGI
jgi:hypothetical protein